MTGFPWPQQDAVDHFQDVELFQDHFNFLAHPACPFFSEAGAEGSTNLRDQSGVVGEPIPTSLPSAVLNPNYLPPPPLWPLPRPPTAIGFPLALVPPLLTAGNNNHNDFNFETLHNSFFPQLDSPLQYFSRHAREPLGLPQSNTNEQNDPTATFESLTRPPDPIATTSTSTTIPFNNATLTTRNGTESTSLAEGPHRVVHDVDGDDEDSNANQVSAELLLQPPSMPATSTRKRTRAASYLDDATGPSSSNNKRRPNTLGRQPTNTSRAPSRVIVENFPEIPDSDDLFGSDPFAEEDLKMFDLTKEDVRPGDLVITSKSKVEDDNRVKLAKFECIICMDSASNLTVTHCGMSFVDRFFRTLCSFPSRYTLESNDQSHKLQVTCSAHDASIKPCTPKLPRRSAPCAGKSSTCDPGMEARLARMQKRSFT